MSTPADIAHTPRFMVLDHIGFLALEGSRSVEFLQGQLTCDMRQASASRAVEGAWCTPKGRVVCSLAAWPQTGERVILRLRADLAAATAGQLSKYAALSRVKISSAPWICVGLLGVDDALLADCLGVRPPAACGGVEPVEGGALLRLDAAGERHELWLERDAAGTWITRLHAHLAEGSGNDWRLALVRTGVAEVQAATRELFLPQMLGYDADGRVSYRKGCYTGQEIVARTHYKGGVKRHLIRLEGEGEPPAPGSAVERAGQSAGTIVEAASINDGHFVVLAVMADEFAASGHAIGFVAGGRELHLPA